MGSVALVVDEVVQGVLEAAGEDLRFQRNREERALATAYLLWRLRSRYVRA
jgi:hypothetical protein